MQQETVSRDNAIGMLHRSYSLDYGRNHQLARAPRPTDSIHPRFHIDFLSIVGQPLKPISRRGAFFDNVYFTLKDWYGAYQSKHTIKAIPFSMQHRTSH